MRITVMSAGSRGDVEPYLALAAGLQRQGFAVRFVANSNFAKLAALHRLNFVPIHVDSYEFVQTRQAQSWLESGSLAGLVRNTIRTVRPMLNQILGDVTSASRGSRLLVYHNYTLPFVYYLGKKLGIPCVPASIYPMPTRAHPALPLRLKRSPGRAFNLLSHAVVNHISWHVFRPVVKEVWGGEIDVSYGNPYHNVIRERQLILCAYSPTVLPKPPDVPENVRVTGYWFLKPPPDWEPDPGLSSFLASGPAPIYVGFGSMGNPAKNRDTTDTILRALAETGCRAVLAAGWSGLGAGQRLSDNVFLLRSIPHSWLFARMSAIVHHGGSGTTGAALASGLPNVVIPHFGDQFFWGRRIAELGAGPEPIARDDLAAEKLSRAISTALHDRDMREKAGMIGSQIRAEDGIDTAVRAIRELLGG